MWRCSPHLYRDKRPVAAAWVPAWTLCAPQGTQHNNARSSHSIVTRFIGAFTEIHRGSRFDSVCVCGVWHTCHTITMPSVFRPELASAKWAVSLRCCFHDCGGVPGLEAHGPRSHLLTLSHPQPIHSQPTHSLLLVLTSLHTCIYTLYKQDEHFCCDTMSSP